MKKHWKKIKWDPRDKDVQNLANQMGISHITASILKLRGITSVAQAKEFINPQLSNLHPPSLLKDLDKAAQRIKEAVKKDEKIMLYGDYDVDGITGVTLLMQALKAMQAQVSYYLPSRFVEGYGLSMLGIEAAHEQGVSLIITIDCGIGAVEEIERAKQLGIDVIITDHHEIKDGLPAALSIVNPNQKDCSYPDKNLAGVGVAMKLACKILDQNQPQDSFIELACLGTIADIVPIIGENRIIAKHGLCLLEKTKNIGLQALIKVSGLSDKKITTADIGFKLGPRLNAAGRLENAQIAIKLLLTPCPQEALEIAEDLDKRNKQRQELQQEIFEQAQKKIVDDTSQPVIVVASEGWHQGVIGIVASKIVEAHHRPTIVISCENGTGKGSGRSIANFHLLNALKECEDLFDAYGGHRQAAGLTIAVDKINQFQQRINDYARKILAPEDIVPCIEVMEIDVDEVNHQLVNEIENLLAPFGIGNPRPIFCSTGLQLAAQPRIVGNNHLKLKLKDKRTAFDAIGFNLGEAMDNLEAGIDVAYTPQINTWQGWDTVQLNLKDIKSNNA